MPDPTSQQIDEFYNAVGKRVKRARAQANLTQMDLSQRTGLTRSSIANLEAGRQRVQAHILAIIASNLGIDLSDLFVQTFPTLSGHSLDQNHSEDLERFSDTALDFVNAGLKVSASSEKL